MANRAKDQNNTIHNNNTGVFTTHINKNTGLMLVTPTGKVEMKRYHKKMLIKKVCKHNTCVDIHKIKHLNLVLLFLTYISKVALILETLSRVLMSLSICILTRQDCSHQSIAQFFAGLTQ